MGRDKTVTVLPMTRAATRHALAALACLRLMVRAAFMIGLVFRSSALSRSMSVLTGLLLVRFTLGLPSECSQCMDLGSACQQS